MEHNLQNPQTEVQQFNATNQDGNKFFPKPDNNLAMAIFTTVCCCLPFGIVAIIKASSVNTLYLSGNQQAACVASADAKKWSMYGIIIGLVVDVLYIIVNLCGAMASL